VLLGSDERYGERLITAEVWRSHRRDLDPARGPEHHLLDPQSEIGDHPVRNFRSKPALELGPGLAPWRDIVVLVPGDPAPETNPDKTRRGPAEAASICPTVNYG
jgi:hypothetical protein